MTPWISSGRTSPGVLSISCHEDVRRPLDREPTFAVQVVAKANQSSNRIERENQEAARSEVRQICFRKGRLVPDPAVGSADAEALQDPMEGFAPLDRVADAH